MHFATSKDGHVYNLPYQTMELHQATKAKNHAEMMRLLQEHKSDPSYVDSLDEDGNTSLHLAVLNQDIRGAEVLLNFGADPRFKNIENINCQDEAILTKNRDLLRKVYMVSRFMKWKDWDEKLPSLLDLMEKFVDFELSVSYDVKSKLPLFNLFAPSDNFKIYKRGSSIRLDYTLVGYRNLRPLRGSSSLVLFGKESPLCGKAIRIDHEKRMWTDALLQFKSPTAEELEEEIDTMLNHKSKTVPDFELMSSDVKICRYLKNGVPFSEPVGEWNCDVYELKDLKVKIMFAKNPEKEKKEREKEKKKEADRQLKLQKQLEKERQRRITAGSPPSNSDALCSSPVSSSEPSASSTKKTKGFVQKLDSIVWIAQGFPIVIKDLLVLFDIIAPFNAQFTEMKQLLDKQLPPGFPVKYVFPIMLDIKASAIFTDFKVREQPSIFFEVPPGYDYTEHGIKLEANDFFKGSKRILDKKSLKL